MTVQSLQDEIETLNEEKGRSDNEVVYLYHQLFICINASRLLSSRHDTRQLYIFVMYTTMSLIFLKIFSFL